MKEKLLKRTSRFGGRVRILGWTNQMPRLLLSHHLVITKAGGATVQEAIAARCPMILNQIIPGQEEGNARLVQQSDIGVFAKKGWDVAEWTAKTFEHESRLWRRWRENSLKFSRPEASIRIAELVLSECEWDGSNRSTINLFAPCDGRNSRSTGSAPRLPESKMLLCDFHIHTNYSDGKLTVPEVVDFYGKRGFDCICITDHLADPRRLIGKLSRLANLAVDG